MSRCRSIIKLVNELEKKVKQIRSCSADPALAHDLEYKLYVYALNLIADGSTDDHQTIAWHVLRAYDPENSNWEPK